MEKTQRVEWTAKSRELLIGDNAVANWESENVCVCVCFHSAIHNSVSPFDLFACDTAVAVAATVLVAQSSTVNSVFLSAEEKYLFFSLFSLKLVRWTRATQSIEHKLPSLSVYYCKKKGWLTNFHSPVWQSRVYKIYFIFFKQMTADCRLLKKYSSKLHISAKKCSSFKVLKDF